MSYAIVDNEGNVYAHDVQTIEKAEEILKNLKDNLTQKQIEDLELEII